MSDLPAFDPDADYPYPEDERERGALLWFYPRRRAQEKAFESARWRLRTAPVDEETGERRRAFDEIIERCWSADPENWAWHFGQQGTYPDVEGWHSIPTVRTDSTDGWEGTSLPWTTSDPSRVYQCDHCGFYTHRDDRAKRHLRDDHPGVEYEAMVQVGAQEMSVVDEAEAGDAVEGPDAPTEDRGQHTLGAFTDGGDC
jgi:hypothetical protein